MLKLTAYVLLMCSLSACGVLRDQNGNPVTQADDFQCKQQCGYFDFRQSIMGVAMCMNACTQAKGYTLHKN